MCLESHPQPKAHRNTQNSHCLIIFDLNNSPVILRERSLVLPSTQMTQDADRTTWNSYTNSNF